MNFPSGSSIGKKGTRLTHLILVALAVAEGLYLIGAIRWTGLFPLVGADFRALYAAAQIARERGLAFVYDLEHQAAVQMALCQVTPTHTPCVLIPMVFPPVFVLPVIPLTWPGPVLAFFLWSALHIVGTLAILRPWVRRMTGSERRQRLAMALLSFPSFTSLFWGQSTLWLLLCVSAFMGDWLQRKTFRAGLWASGLLLKPQTMILLLPALALARQWRILAGTLTRIAGLVGLSLLLAGPAGGIAWGRLLRRFAQPVPAVTPEVVGVETMMNWRSIGALLGRWMPSRGAWAIAGIGVLLTIGFAMRMARRMNLQEPLAPERFTLGVLAATLATTWHAHNHTALVLTPLLLRLEASGAFPRRALALWMLIPAWVPFVDIMLGAVGLLPPIAGFDNLIAGKILFGFNLYMLWFAAREDFNSPRRGFLIFHKSSREICSVSQS